MLAFAACGAPVSPSDISDEQAKTNVNEAVIATSSTQSIAFDVNADISFAVENAQTEEAENFENIAFNMTISGEADATDSQSPRFLADIDVDGGDEKAEFESEMSLGFGDGSIFAKLSALELSGELENQVPPEMLTPFLEQWWSMALPPQATAEFTKMLQLNSDPEMEKQINEIRAKHEMFTDIKHVETTSNGERYSVIIDTDAIIAMAEEVAKLYGTEVNEQDMAMAKELYKSLAMTAEVEVNKEGLISEISGEVSLSNPVEEGAEAVTVMVDFTYKLSKHNEELEITMPEDAQVFDPMMLLGGMMMEQQDLSTFELEEGI